MLSEKLTTWLLKLNNIGQVKIDAVVDLLQVGNDPELEEDRQLILKMHKFLAQRHAADIKALLTEIAVERYPGNPQRVTDIVSNAVQVLRQISYASNEKSYWLDRVSTDLFGVPVAELPVEAEGGITLIGAPGVQIDHVVHIMYTKGGAAVVTDASGKRTKLIAGTFTLRID